MNRSSVTFPRAVEWRKKINKTKKNMKENERIRLASQMAATQQAKFDNASRHVASFRAQFFHFLIRRQCFQMRVHGTCMNISQPRPHHWIPKSVIPNRFRVSFVWLWSNCQFLPQFSLNRTIYCIRSDEVGLNLKTKNNQSKSECMYKWMCSYSKLCMHTHTRIQMDYCSNQIDGICRAHIIINKYIDDGYGHGQ